MGTRAARKEKTPVAELWFDYSNHQTKVSVAEQLQGQSGWLALNLLKIEAFQLEEHLVFTGMSDCGRLIDGEACKSLFNVGGKCSIDLSSDKPPQLLNNQQRQIEAKLAEAMDANHQYFQYERDKLESRHAVSMEEQQKYQKLIRESEKKQRRQRKEVFDVEDEIIEKRDELIAALELRLKQKTEVKELFTVRWHMA